MSVLPYSIVIATFERPEEIRLALESIAGSTRAPGAVVVVDSSRSDRVRRVVGEFEGRLPIRWISGQMASAAGQRNQGALEVRSPLVVFMDDDSILRPDTLELLLAPFGSDPVDEIGGIAGRIDGMQHPVPKGPLWWYYRVQAGYSDPDYGGKCFGPGINCLPTYREGSPALISSDWLNSTCVAYRTEVFLTEMFPAFEGYSSMEDVHLSVRVGRGHRLFFHRDAIFRHLDAGSEFKRNRRALAQSRMRHRRAFARDVLGLRGPLFEFKLLLHRLFVTVCILRSRGGGKWEEIAGTWS